MDLATWLELAQADADRRGLSALRPLLVTLAQATAELRQAPWTEDAGADLAGPRPPGEVPPPRTDA